MLAHYSRSSLLSNSGFFYHLLGQKKQQPLETNFQLFQKIHRIRNKQMTQTMAALKKKAKALKTLASEFISQ